MIDQCWLNGFVTSISKVPNFLGSIVPERKEVEQVVVHEVKSVQMLPAPGHFFVRLAGLSGAAAVALGAYGAHAFKDREPDETLHEIYATSSRYHYMHSLALLAVPLTKRPYLVGTLLTSGMAIFCGSLYYHALSGDSRFRKITPYGGMLLIAGWLAMVF